MKTLLTITFSILIFFLSKVNCQERLTSINLTEDSQERIYLGIEADNLYYLNVKPNGYFVVKESLSDNVFESIVIYRVDISEGPFEFFALHEGKVLLNNASTLLIYYIEDDHVEKLDIARYNYNYEILFSYNKAFFPFLDSLIEIDLQNLEIATTDNIEKEVLDGIIYKWRPSHDFRIFLQDGKNVLLDSFAISFVTDTAIGSSFYSVNLHTKEITKILQLAPGVTISNGIWPADPGWNIYRSGNIGKAFFYTFRQSTNGIIAKEIPLNFDYNHGIAFLSDTHLIGSEYYLDNFNSICKELIVVQDIINGTYQEYSVDCWETDEYVIKVVPEGYYSVDGTKLKFNYYEGNSKTILSGFSNYSFNYFINSYYYVFGDKWLISAYKSNGSRTQFLVNENSVTELDSMDIHERIFDGGANKTILRATTDDHEFAYHEIFNDEILALQKSETPTIFGGKFQVLKNTHDPIVRGTGEDQSLHFYNLTNNFIEINHLSDSWVPTSDFVQVGDYFYFFRVSTLKNTVSRFHLENKTMEVQSINYINDKPNSFYDLYKGYDFFLLDCYKHSNQKIYMSTIDLEGNFRTLVDENNSEAYSLIPNDNDIISTNGHIYALAKDPNGESLVVYKMGIDKENTTVLLDNLDFNNDEGIFLLAEGNQFSYIKAGENYFVKNDGETNYLSENNSDNPYYYDGKFYFNNRYFDENSETFIDWNSGLDNIQHIQNDIAFSKIDDNSIALVNVNTLEKEILTTATSEAVYFSGHTQTVIFLPQTGELYWSDGSISGTFSVELPDAISIGKDYSVENDLFMFTGSREDVGYELFLIDNTGELIVFDINEGFESSAPSSFVSNDNYMFFTAFEDEYGVQLYGINLNDPTSTVETYPKIEQIEIYPNPSNEFVTSKTQKSIQRIDIINSLGKKIKTIRINSESELQNMDISFLSSGIYYIKYFNSDQFIGVSTLSKI